jgi:hypothetical protein
VIFLENEILYGQTFDVPKIDDFVLPIGKARRWHALVLGRHHRVFGIGMTYALSRRPRSWPGWAFGGGDRPAHHCARWTCRHGDRSASRRPTAA